AYTDAAGRSPSDTLTADLGGQTIVSGVHRGDTFGLTGTLTLDAQGDPNAVFIFQAASTLTTASGSHVALINGASPCNVFWQVGSSATLGTTSVFVGTILALTSVTAQTGASVTGRLLASNGAVTLDTNTVTRPEGCAGSTRVSSTITADAPVQGLFNLRARLTQTTGGAPIVGRMVVMSTSAGPIGNALTDADGVATFSGLGAAAQIILENGYTASFSGDDQFLASSARPTLLNGATGSSVQSAVPIPASGPAPTTVSQTTLPVRPSGRLPATGDVSHLRSWGLLLLAMGGGISLGLSALRRRE
ncbi:MAG: DUF3494 domain-containing protein, partial [Actinobacteria bacterium]|nr:DUF3494 domain-containing protein [Actinomycetota bacterium]